MSRTSRFTLAGALVAGAIALGGAATAAAATDLAPLRTGAAPSTDSVRTVNARLATDPALGRGFASSLSAGYAATMSELFVLSDSQLRAARAAESEIRPSLADAEAALATLPRGTIVQIALNPEDGATARKVTWEIGGECKAPPPGQTRPDCKITFKIGGSF
jgi:hypothetical protein